MNMDVECNGEFDNITENNFSNSPYEQNCSRYANGALRAVGAMLRAVNAIINESGLARATRVKRQKRRRRQRMRRRRQRGRRWSSRHA